MGNPYSGLPDERYWRRAVARVEPFELDPVTSPGFTIAPSDLVATAGSCFAQHISRSLRGTGFGYWEAEDAPVDMSEEEAIRLSYGVFSCRYGNIYTTAQLAQLFDEAFSEPRLDAWQRSDGRWVDPLRPQVTPEGFASPEEVHEARRHHLAAVRRMFEGLDVFIFTLGLTETWVSRADGTVYPLAPGVVAGSFEPSRHRFVNLSVRDVEHDLGRFITSLRLVNPRSRILLTVSPVPLIATYEPRHVLVSTTWSKSVLRVAAQSAADTFQAVDYFPSFEIVTGNHAAGRYFEDDLREVSPLGVAHAMRIFLKHYAAAAEPARETRPVPPRPESLAPAAVAGDILCDEEALEQAGM